MWALSVAAMQASEASVTGAARLPREITRLRWHDRSQQQQQHRPGPHDMFELHRAHQRPCPTLGLCAGTLPQGPPAAMSSRRCREPVSGDAETHETSCEKNRDGSRPGSEPQHKQGHAIVKNAPGRTVAAELPHLQQAAPTREGRGGWLCCFVE